MDTRKNLPRLLITCFIGSSAQGPLDRHVLRRVMKASDWQLPIKGFIPMSGQIVDGSLVPPPKQRNTDAEKEAIKAGRLQRRSGQTNPASPRRRTVDAH